MAEELVGHCDRVKAALAGEAAPEPARHFVGRAREGWLAVAANGRVTAPQWDAMRGLLAGGAPVWHDAKGRQGEAGKRAKDAGAWVGQMQLRVAAQHYTLQCTGRRTMQSSEHTTDEYNWLLVAASSTDESQVAPHPGSHRCAQ